VLSVSGHAVIVKKITLPEMTEEELAESIKWEAEQYIPFDIQDVNMDFQILNTFIGPEGKPQMNVILVAVKKDKLNDYHALAIEAGLDPIIVDVDAFALENMYSINYDPVEGEAVALVNVGASVTNINVLLSGHFAFTRDISIGGNRFTESIQKEMGLSHEDAERVKLRLAVDAVDPETLSAIEENVSGEIAGEIIRSFGYFKTTTNHEHIDRVLVSGGGSKIPNFISLLQEKLETPVSFVEPFRKITVDPMLFDADYIREIAPLVCVSVGLGIRKPGDR
jgi:type IV pilus assembly protein PilM